MKKTFLPRPNSKYAKQVPVDPEEQTRYGEWMTNEVRRRLEKTNEPTKLPDGMVDRVLKNHRKIVGQAKRGE